MSARDVATFAKGLADVDRSKRVTEVFADFCEMAYLALAKSTAHPDSQDGIEAEYMACVARYRNKDDVRKMRPLLQTAVAVIEAGGRDFLGEVAGEIGALDAGLGQFFTPYDVSRLLAEMNLSDAGAIIREKGFLTLCEPAAGAGGMILAAADAIERAGFDPRAHLWFEAVELNAATFHMLHVQTAYRGLAGKCIHGNSLSLETYRVSLTPNALPFLLEHGNPHAARPGDAPPPPVVAAPERPPAPPAEPVRTSPRQLSLFD